MPQRVTFGKFYGVSRKRIETPAFAFVEVEDLGNIKVPSHTHENAHFVFVIKGQYEAVIKEKKQLCPPSTIIYYPAGTTHSDHFSSEGVRQFLTISLSADTNKKLIKEIKFLDNSISLYNSEISWIGKRICKEIRFQDGLSSMILEGLANELLVYVSRNVDRSHKLPDWLKLACELFNDCNYGTITISEIATQVGVHPIYLARTFRKYFQCSPGEYLRKRRIELASELLIDKKKSLAEIALVTGFPDQSEFTRSFKQHTGMTPAIFRKLNNS